MEGWFDKEVTALSSQGWCWGADLFKTVTWGRKRRQLRKTKAHLAIRSYIKPTVSLPSLLVKHEIFISCIFGGKALKGSGVDPPSLQSECKARSTPLSSLIKNKLYSVFVSCWFFTKHDVTTSGCIFSKTDSMNTVMDPDYTGWLYCYRWQNTNLFIFRSFFPPLAHLDDATISSLRRKTTSSEQWLWHINLSSGLLTHTPQRKTSHSVSLSCSVSVCVCVFTAENNTLKQRISCPHSSGWFQDVLSEIISMHQKMKLEVKQRKRFIMFTWVLCYDID